MRTLKYDEAVSMVGKVPHLYSWHANDETLLGADVPARWGCKLHLIRRVSCSPFGRLVRRTRC